MKAISSVKGTRDFYPEDLAFRNWLLQQIRTVSEKYGYQEFDGPFLESLDLYAAKSGEELVKEQSFVFPDRSGEMIALRPELTPSLARMIAARSREMPFPIRWWSFGPFWRYERPQRGRTREFFQWNIDILGVESPEADAEIVAVAADFFRQVGLSPAHVRIQVNNRELMENMLAEIGITGDSIPATFRLIDRVEKLSTDQWNTYAEKQALDATTIQQLQNILANRDAWMDWESLVAFFNACDALGVRDYVVFDPTVVRGLDYYTGTVFEARDVERRFRAILGGGRYDDLVSAVGGDRIPATGYAMGDVILKLVLEAYDIIPELRSNPAQVLVPTFDAESLDDALELAGELRAGGLKVEWYPSPDRLAKQFKYANRYGIPFVAILGPDELARGEVSVKDMRSGSQVEIERKQLVAKLFEMLEPML
jgi:histidyl-tRNA synthetase